MAKFVSFDTDEPFKRYVNVDHIQQLYDYMSTDGTSRTFLQLRDGKSLVVHGQPNHIAQRISS